MIGRDKGADTRAHQKADKRADERAIALDVILAVTDGGEYLNGLLSRVLGKEQDKKKRAFITRLCTGTIERLLTIDHVINMYARPNTDRQKPVIRAVLRLGVYQILYMDSIPDHAACNESVRLAKERHMSGLSGFVNAVLRNIIRHKGELISEILLDEDIKDKSDKELSIALSVPEWILGEYIKSFGRTEAVKALFSMYERSGGVSLRANTLRCDPARLWEDIRDSGAVVSESQLPFAAVVSSFDKVESLPGYDEGLFYVQDLSSIEAVCEADLTSGDGVLDLCAAPGGKSFGCRMLLGDSGSVTSCDISKKKLDLIRDNANRLRIYDIEITQNDANILNPKWEMAFDLVLCDLPCSGLGTLAKKPELKYRISPGDIEKLSSIQERMLDISAGYVKEGGRLLFSTCTITKKENEENTEGFLMRHPDFSLISSALIKPDKMHDGFWWALFKRN